jgi:hypothetical protein
VYRHWNYVHTTTRRAPEVWIFGPGNECWKYLRNQEALATFRSFAVGTGWIRFGERADYGGIVVGIVGAVVGVIGVVGNRSVGSDLLFDPFPITQVAIWQRHNPLLSLRDAVRNEMKRTFPLRIV